jgi:hypothetical protein
VITDSNFAKDFCTSPYIDVAANPWGSNAADSHRDLMEDKAVWTDLCVIVDDDAVRVRDEQSPADV